MMTELHLTSQACYIKVANEVSLLVKPTDPNVPHFKTKLIPGVAPLKPVELHKEFSGPLIAKIPSHLC